MNDVARVVLYGLVAAASPAVLVLTLGILATARARLNGSIFAAAFVFAQAMTFLIVFFLGAAATRERYGGVATYLEVSLGVILLALAWRGRPPHPPKDHSGPNAIETRLARFGQIRARTCLVFGLLLGVGSKRLVITAVAAGSLAVSGLSAGEDFGLGVLYVLIASAVVWLPVVAYLILGSRANAWVAKARQWMAAHTDALTFASALVLGLLFVVDAAVKLVLA